MTKNTHITIGILTGTILINELNFLTPIQSLLCVSSVVVGSILPDIDHPKSYLGSKLLLISYPIYKLFGHRTITHSVLFWTALLFIAPCLNQGLVYGLICISIYFGAMSHIALDLISPVGIAMLYPLCDKRFHLLPDSRRYNYKKKHKGKYKSKHRKRLPI